jgi:poly(3-hydroxybutyrate) depolymerase
VKFFDALLAGLRRDFKVDDKRIYVTGFSAGAGFTFVFLILDQNVVAWASVKYILTRSAEQFVVPLSAV